MPIIAGHTAEQQQAKVNYRLAEAHAHQLPGMKNKPQDKNKRVEAQGASQGTAKPRRTKASKCLFQTLKSVQNDSKTDAKER